MKSTRQEITPTGAGGNYRVFPNVDYDHDMNADAYGKVQALFGFLAETALSMSGEAMILLRNQKVPVPLRIRSAQ